MKNQRLPENYSELGLEDKKLALEVAELQLPWWRKPKYLGVLLPTVLGAITVSIALFTNIIDKRILNYQNDLERLTKKEDSLREIINLQVDSFITLHEVIKTYKATIEKRDSVVAIQQKNSQQTKERLDLVEAEFQKSVDDARSCSEKLALLNSQKRSLIGELKEIEESKADLAAAYQDSIRVYKKSFNQSTKPSTTQKENTYHAYPMPFILDGRVIH